jgi:hypothetical protein
MKKVYVSDFRIEDGTVGGSEFIDRTLVSILGSDFQYSGSVEKFDPSCFYIISNLSRLPSQELLHDLVKCRYIIIEHDYKFVANRHPWRFKDCLVPPNLIVNRDLYKNAILTLVQSGYHLDVFRRNRIEGRFYNARCGVWSDSEIVTLTEIASNPVDIRKDFAIIRSNNWIKNTKGAIEFCQRHTLNFDLISDNNWTAFLQKLNSYAALVFFPIAGETLCRLVVEARCLGLNVITNPVYGATLEDWYKLRSFELISFLSNRSKQNVEALRRVLSS